MTRQPRSKGFGLLGVGAVACAACCAPPLFGAVAGLAASGVLASLFVGVTAPMVAAALIVLVVIRRQRSIPHPGARRFPMKKLIPIYDATADIACTIEDAEVPDRVALIEGLRLSASSIERTDHGLLLTFPSDDETEADLRRFAVDEKRCCSFWGFAVDRSAEAITLQWDGPPGTTELVDRLHEFFLGDEPLTALSGLL